MKFWCLFILLVLTASSCSQQGNYDMVSEMNPSHAIEIVYYDEASREQLGAFPLSRSVYADLVHEIEKDSPALVILKFFFDLEKDQDVILAEEISRYDNVLTQASAVLDSQAPVSEGDMRALSLNDVSNGGSESIVLPNGTLINSFAGIGLVDFKTIGTEYMDFPLFQEVDKYEIPSLALKSLMVLTGNEVTLKREYLQLGKSRIDHSDGFCRIDLSEPGKFYKEHSMIDVLANGADNIDFNDKIVIVFIDDDSVRNITSAYGSRHNSAEIVPDSINTLLQRIQ